MKTLPQGLILDELSLQTAVDYFLTQPAFLFDTETIGDHRDQPQHAPVTWISLATEGCAIVIPIGHELGEFTHTEKVPTQYKTGKNAGKYYNKTVKRYGKPPEQMESASVFEILKPLFFHPGIVKAGHDVLFDIVAISKYYGSVPPGPYSDTKIMYWLLDENDRQGSYLKNMIERRYGFVYDTEGIGACVESHPFSLVAYYSYCDSKMGWLCYKNLRPKITEAGLEPIYNIEMALLNVMIGMRINGVRINVEELMVFREELIEKLTEAEGNIYRAAGHKFNINSNKQKQEILYNEQKLRPWKLTKGGKDKFERGEKLTIYDYSVDADALETYLDNPVASSLGEYAKISKVLSTYVESWLGNNGEAPLIIDGYIHAGFQQYGTVTGRFSCRAPNLQNPPRPHTWLGKRLRSLFVPEPGGKLVVADYSQIELVILAHYIGEGALYEGFLQGIDPHTLTAAMVLDKLAVIGEEGGITKVERQDLGKTLGFAVVYGAGLKKVASMAHLDMNGAKRVMRKHEMMFPEIHAFKQAVINLARSRKPVPYITTLLGRKRRVPALNSRNDKIRMGAERQVFNSLIQGGAGDILKLAMIRLDAILPPEAKIVMTVHDEIVVSCPEEIAEEVARLMTEAMTGEGIQKLVRVPLKIELNIVDRWDLAK